MKKCHHFSNKVYVSFSSFSWPIFNSLDIPLYNFRKFIFTFFDIKYNGSVVSWTRDKKLGARRPGQTNNILQVPSECWHSSPVFLKKFKSFKKFGKLNFFLFDFWFFTWLTISSSSSPRFPPPKRSGTASFSEYVHKKIADSENQNKACDEKKSLVVVARF